MPSTAEVAGDGEADLGRRRVHETVAGVLVGHQAVPGGSHPAAVVRVHGDEGRVALPPPTLEVMQDLGLRQQLFPRRLRFGLFRSPVDGLVERIPQELQVIFPAPSHPDGGLVGGDAHLIDVAGRPGAGATDVGDEPGDLLGGGVVRGHGEHRVLARHGAHNLQALHPVEDA